MTGIFVAVLLTSNLLSSAKIIDVGGLVFDAGTLLFPLAYIFGDIFAEVYGYQKAKRVIWTGFLASALFAVFIALAGVLPGEAAWLDYAGNAAYAAILGGVPGLIVASLAAYLLGSLSNAWVMAYLKRVAGRWLPVRTIGSTLVGQAVDTVLFFGIATALGVFPADILWSLIAFNYVFKVGVEVLFTPLTIFVISIVRRVEPVLE